MPNQAYVVLATIVGTAGSLEMYVAIADGEDEARDIIATRPGARPNEDIMVPTALNHEATRKIGADLSQAGLYRNFTPGGSN